MLSRDVAVVLIATGILAFVIGWVLILSNYGIDLKSCSTYVSVPNKFEGVLSLLSNYTQYVTIVFGKISNVTLSPGETYRDTISLNTSAVSPFLVKYDIVSESKNVTGSITVRDSKNATLLYIPLQYNTSTVSDSKFFLSPPSMPKGVYTIEINASSKFRVVSFNISALSFESSPSIKFDLSPSSWNQREIRYVCGVDARGMFVAAALIGFGIAIITFVALDAYKSTEIARVKISAPKKKKR
ncbi:MAG: hypothetical protein QW348_04735 [Ignisphaera sp.]